MQHDTQPDELDLSGLPGAELVGKGLRDLASSVTSIEALLVVIQAANLERLGIVVPDPGDLGNEPELRLYEAIGDHAGYNAWVDRSDKFVRAASARHGFAGDRR